MKYDAFISYRHLEKDMYVAKRVHKALETTKIPRKIQKEIGRKKINRVFRDQEELPIGSDLGSNIEAALEEAEFLIVICSPKTQESYWVMKEIDTFISLHGRENVLAVLVEGEPGDSFPPQLLTDEKGNPVEPLAADVRGKNNKEIKRKLKTESLRLAASILRVDYDDLKQRHRERQMKKTLRISVAIAAVITGLAVAFGLYNAYNLDKINNEYQQKLANESKVLAAKSQEILETGDRRAATLLALAGLPVEEDDRPFVPESMYSLAKALDCYDIGESLTKDDILVHNIQVSDFEMNADGTRVISTDADGFVYGWNLETGEELFEIEPMYTKYDICDIKAIGFANDKFVMANNLGIYAYDDKGELVFKYEPDLDEKVYHAKVLDDQNYIIVSTETRAIVLDDSTGKVVKQYENHLDDNYANDIAMSTDGKYLIMPHFFYSGDEQPNCVTIYNLETDEYKDVVLAESYTMNILVSTENELYVSTMNSEATYSYKPSQIYLDKIDIENGTVLWTQSEPYTAAVLGSGYSRLATFNGTDDEGNPISYVAVNEPQAAYILKGEDGSLYNTISLSSFIQRMGFNVKGRYLMIGSSDGRFTPYPVDPEEAYVDRYTQVEEDMMDFHMSNGVLVARTYRSPNLIVMRYKTDDSKLYTLDSEENTIVEASPDGNTFITEKGSYDEGYTIIVHDTVSGEVKGSFELPNSVGYGDVHYINDDRIVAVGNDACVYKYSVSKKKLDTKKPAATITSAKVSYTENGKYALIYTGREYAIGDLDNDFEIIAEGSSNEVYFYQAALSSDAKKIFYIDNMDGNKFYAFDLETEKSECISESYCNTYCESADGNVLAIASADGKLKLMRSQDYEEIDELEYYSSYRNTIQFSPDGKYIVLQGDDLYIKIYDLAAKKFVYLSDFQTNEIKHIAFDTVNNRVAIANYWGLAMIDMNSFGQLANIRYARLYIPAHNMILSVGDYGNSEVFAFKFRELEDLIKLAKEQYPDAELTAEEKLKYGIM